MTKRKKKPGTMITRWDMLKLIRLAQFLIERSTPLKAFVLNFSRVGQKKQIFSVGRALKRCEEIPQKFVHMHVLFSLSLFIQSHINCNYCFYYHIPMQLQVSLRSTGYLFYWFTFINLNDTCNSYHLLQDACHQTSRPVYLIPKLPEKSKK